MSQYNVHEVLHRTHIPSQSEVQQSLRLIRQYKDEATLLQLQISTTEEAHRIQENELTNRVEEQIGALRRQLAVEIQTLSDTMATYTQPLRQQLAEVEKRLDSEQHFISGMRRIPPEILIEIFKLHLDYRLPSRTLALVCKEWRALLLGTPSFWSQISAKYVMEEGAERDTAALLLRINLTKSALLNIAFYPGNKGWGYKSAAMFPIVSSINLCRWRSLQLNGLASWYEHRLLELAPLFGKFSSLHTLKICYPMYTLAGESEKDPFNPIYQKILQDHPPLEVLEIDGDLPMILRDAKAYQNVKSLKAVFTTVPQLHPLRHLDKLEVTGHTIGDSFDLSLFPPLPSNTSWQPVIKRHQLAALRLHLVTSLKIPSFESSSIEQELQFPVLQTLEITEGDIWNIYDVHAPMLTKLSIRKWYRESDRGSKTTKVAALFKNQTYKIGMMPTTLDIDLALGPTAFNAILDHWSQLQHLTITYGKEFPWKNSFASALGRGSIGRNLITLCLIPVKHSNPSWKEIAQNVLNTRKNTTLKSIKYKSSFTDWDQVTVD